MNIDDCQLSVEASDLATLPDLDIFTSARVFMSVCRPQYYLDLNLCIIYTYNSCSLLFPFLLPFFSLLSLVRVFRVFLIFL